VYDDDQPLPSYIAGMPDGDDDTTPPPGWAAVRVLRDEGLWTTDQLEQFSWLCRRGVAAFADDPDAVEPVRASAHLPPTGYTPGGVPNE
jgi:hypothetical protein